VRNLTIGRRLGEERKGSCGRDRERSVFCVKGRGELGGLNGRMKSILWIGSRGRIFEIDCSTWVGREIDGA
jgi:hypothetical protein